MKPLRRHQVSRRGENIEAGSSDSDDKNPIVTEGITTPSFDGGFDTLEEVRSDDELLSGEPSGPRSGRSWGIRRKKSAENQNARHNGTEMTGVDQAGGHVVYKVYKRRWFGMIQLALLNIIVSWDVSLELPRRILLSIAESNADQCSTVAIILTRLDNGAYILWCL